MLDTIFFSSLFLHKERDKPDTGKGSLHYFSGIFLFIGFIISYLFTANKLALWYQ